jgi:hypothetical protein
VPAMLKGFARAGADLSIAALPNQASAVAGLRTVACCTQFTIRAAETLLYRALLVLLEIQVDQYGRTSMRNLKTTLCAAFVLAAPLLVVGTEPAAAGGRGCFKFAPSVYGYAFFRPRLATARAYRARAVRVKRVRTK